MLGGDLFPLEPNKSDIGSLVSHRAQFTAGQPTVHAAGVFFDDGKVECR